MIIHYLPKFKKQYKKLPDRQKQQFNDRLHMFFDDPTQPMLRIHPLKGSYAGYWSMNISGDLRAIYLIKGEDIIIFALIGTHSELYGK